jgi:hypothetical protein
MQQEMSQIGCAPAGAEIPNSNTQIPGNLKSQ